MAMRYHRLTVLAGAMLALALMTCLSGEFAKLREITMCSTELESLT
jgi:putative Ca2+/H+ antiporter (TMEM165/GDT1 family)